MIFRIGCYCIIGLFLWSCNTPSSNGILKLQATDSIDTLKQLISLGKELFSDQRLSQNNTISCASCHQPRYAFTDKKPKSIGIHGREGRRNTPTLWNAKNQDKFMWDGGVKSLELQAIVPIRDSNEMGENISVLFHKLSAIKKYDSIAQQLYQRSFDPFVMTRALSAYQKSIYRENSAFDDWQKKGIINDSAIVRGYQLFTEHKCTACHSGNTFTNNSIQNNGIYKEGDDTGRYRITKDTNDIGKFKVPTLRNVAVTNPYMHDGSLKTLREVILHHEQGGLENATKSSLIIPFELSKQERKDLIFFLKSLTDSAFVE